MKHTARRAWIVLCVGALCGAAGGAAVYLRKARNVGGEAGAVPSTRQRVPLEARETIYDSGLRPGWEDASGGTRELKAGAPARVDFSGFGGLTLRHSPLDAGYAALAFRFKAPAGLRDFLQVSLSQGQQDTATFPRVAVTDRDIAALEDGWSEVLIPFRALNPSATTFDRIVIQAQRMVEPGEVLIDKLVLAQPSPKDRHLAARPAKRTRVKVDCRAQAKPISPLIYGIAHGIIASGETAHRIGGNAMTRLNWEQGNLWNTGNDWFFENTGSGAAGLSDWLREAQTNNVQMAVTVPLIGWVAKDATSVGFPKSTFGPQRKHDPNRQDAGDGFTPDGKPLTPGAPTLTSEEASPERVRGWIEKIRKRDAAAGKRSIHMYLLDNEPDLWHHTHRDVHPAPLGYDELLERTLRYASAIRAADPDAVIAGPTSWGWTGYFYSAKDAEAGTMLQPDRRAHGGTPLIPWYLQQLAAHQQKTGEKLLDVLDVHYYPQADGVYGEGKTDANGAALRIRSTRSLWDPTYRDESWIKESVHLLPRLRAWVEHNYPGRGISLGEWSFGAESHISGGLATAEALGRFGQQGLTAAFYWSAPKAGSATFWAFRAFRNYDGKGGRFLDLSVPTEAAQAVSTFVSRDEASSRFVAVILNLDADNAVAVELDAASCGALTRTRSFSYDATSDGLSEDAPEKTAGLGSTESVLKPYSIKIVELHRR